MRVGGDEALGDAAVRVGVGAAVAVGVGCGRGVRVAADGVGRGSDVAEATGGVAEVGWSRCRISVTPNAVTATIPPISTNSTASRGERRDGGGGGAGQGFHPGGRRNGPGG